MKRSNSEEEVDVKKLKEDFSDPIEIDWLEDY